VKVRYRHITVKVYRKTPRYPFYRIAYRADGRRVVRNFRRLNETRKEAEKKARELAQGNEAAATLSKAEAQACKFAVTKLRELSADLNVRKLDPAAPEVALSLEDAIAEYVEAKRRIGPARLVEAANAYLSIVAGICRVNVNDAAAEFLKEREARTKPEKEGARPKLSPRMAYQDRLRIDRFTHAFGKSDVCDLRPEHLDLFFTDHLKGMAPRSRNHFRSTLSVFLKWCVRKSYLPENHGSRKSNGFCPDGKTKEPTDTGDVEVYSPSELAALLAHAHGPLRPLIAIGGLAGLRTEELLRLEWSDVWRRPGYIEVTGRKAKTRARRLVPVGPALAAWRSSDSPKARCGHTSSCATTKPCAKCAPGQRCNAATTHCDTASSHTAWLSCTTSTRSRTKLAPARR
jgi:hypothetical protein